MARETSSVLRGSLDLGHDDADGFGMVRPDDRTLDMLALCCEPRSVGRLGDELAPHGIRMDLVQSLAELRSSFFERGGHEILLLAPDLPVQLAERAARALRELDPEVGLIAFGRELTHAELPDPVTQLPEFHPTSRAGFGAILRVIKER